MLRVPFTQRNLERAAAELYAGLKENDSLDRLARAASKTAKETLDSF